MFSFMTFKTIIIPVSDNSVWNLNKIYSYLKWSHLSAPGSQVIDASGFPFLPPIPEIHNSSGKLTPG